jgi:hypothetical protein
MNVMYAAIYTDLCFMILGSHPICTCGAEHGTTFAIITRFGSLLVFSLSRDCYCASILIESLKLGGAI